MPPSFQNCHNRRWRLQILQHASGTKHVSCQGFLEWEYFHCGVLQKVALVFCPRACRVNTKQWSAAVSFACFCYIVLSHSGSINCLGLALFALCQGAALECSKDHIQLAEAWAEKKLRLSYHRCTNEAWRSHSTSTIHGRLLDCCVVVFFFLEVGTGWVAKAQSSSWLQIDMET